MSKDKQEARTMKVSIEIDGQFITTEFPLDADIRALFDNCGCLRGVVDIKNHPE